MSNLSTNHSAVWQTHPIATCTLCVMVISGLACILVGNILVCLAVCLVRRLRHQPGAYLLVSLAVADLFVGLVVMPPALVYLVTGNWMFGLFLCKLWTTADVTLCTASILSLCVISVDRYYIITDPFKYAITSRTTRRMLLYIVGVWSAALIVAVVPLFAFPIVQDKSKCQVSQNIYYQMYATMLSFYIPTLIILVVNCQIYRAAQRLRLQDKTFQHEVSNFEPERPSVHQSATFQSSINGCIPSPRIDASKKQRRTLSTPSSGTNILGRVLLRPIHGASDLISRSASVLTRQQSSVGHNNPNHHNGGNKTLKTLGVIMSCYIICWLPFFILALVKPIFALSVPKWLDAGFLWLGWLNSLLNPFIYAKFNREFRTPFWLMLRCQFANLNSACRNRANFATDYTRKAKSSSYQHEDNNAQVLIRSASANQHVALECELQPMSEQQHLDMTNETLTVINDVAERIDGSDGYWTNERTI